MYSDRYIVGKVFDRTHVYKMLGDSSGDRLAAWVKSWVYANSWGEDV